MNSRLGGGLGALLALRLVGLSYFRNTWGRETPKVIESYILGLEIYSPVSRRRKARLIIRSRNILLEDLSLRAIS